ncbi:hypothetical protein [Nostoc sp. DSM 114160]
MKNVDPEGAYRRVTQHFHSFVGLRFASPNLQFFTKPSVSIGNLFFDADGIGKAAQVQIAQFSNQAIVTNVNITVIA